MNNVELYIQRIFQLEKFYKYIQQWREDYKKQYYEDKLPTESTAVKTIGYAVLGY